MIREPKTLRLSDSTYGSDSIAAVCVAAHECGHAIQDQREVWPAGSAKHPGTGWRILVPQLVLAGVFRRTDLYPSVRWLTAGIILFSLGGTVSAGDASGGVQRILDAH